MLQARLQVPTARDWCAARPSRGQTLACWGWGKNGTMTRTIILSLPASSHIAAKSAVGFVLREQLMTLITGMQGYSPEHRGMAVHTVLDLKQAKPTVWLLWLLTLPNPGATKRTRALQKTIPLEAAIRQLGTVQSVATNGRPEFHIECQGPVVAPSAMAKEVDIGRMAQGASILLLQSATMLC